MYKYSISINKDKIRIKYEDDTSIMTSITILIKYNIY